MSTAVRRGFGALLSLGALLVGALAVDAVVEHTRPSILAEATAAFASPPVRDESTAKASESEEGAALEGGDGGWGELVVPDASDGEVRRLPEGFESEVLPAGQLVDLRVSDEGTVIGFSLSTEPAEAFAHLEQRLAERGWRAVPAGNGSSGTFVKEIGRFNWLYVACMRVGDATSVVMQCAAEQGKD